MKDHQHWVCVTNNVWFAGRTWKKGQRYSGPQPVCGKGKPVRHFKPIDPDTGKVVEAGAEKPVEDPKPVEKPVEDPREPEQIREDIKNKFGIVVAWNMAKDKMIAKEAELAQLAAKDAEQNTEG